MLSASNAKTTQSQGASKSPDHEANLLPNHFVTDFTDYIFLTLFSNGIDSP